MSSLFSVFSSPKKPEQQAAPAAPKPENADAKAKEDMLRRRKIQARTGGKTILASNFGANVDTQKDLLGQ